MRWFLKIASVGLLRILIWGDVKRHANHAIAQLPPGPGNAPSRGSPVAKFYDIGVMVFLVLRILDGS